ncbi:unnamed protein product [Phaeothamnion confervicola]
MLTVQHPFLNPRGNRELRLRVDDAIRHFAHSTGDHMTYLAVYDAFELSVDPRTFCEEHCLSYPAMARARELRAQLWRHVRRLGPPEKDDGGRDKGGGCNDGGGGSSGGGGGGTRALPSCGGDESVLRRCLVVGYFSNAAQLGHDGR